MLVTDRTARDVAPTTATVVEADVVILTVMLSYVGTLLSVDQTSPDVAVMLLRVLVWSVVGIKRDALVMTVIAVKLFSAAPKVIVVVRVLARTTGGEVARTGPLPGEENLDVAAVAVMLPVASKPTVDVNVVRVV